MNRIRQLRIDNDIKQKEIAKYLNIKQQQYSRYEYYQNPNIDIYILLANFYNTSIDYIVGITNEIKPYPRNKKRGI